MLRVHLSDANKIDINYTSVISHMCNESNFIFQ
jgi:hypothetical protein